MSLHDVNKVMVLAWVCDDSINFPLSVYIIIFWRTSSSLVHESQIMSLDSVASLQSKSQGIFHSVKCIFDPVHVKLFSHKEYCNVYIGFVHFAHFVETVSTYERLSVIFEDYSYEFSSYQMYRFRFVWASKKPLKPVMLNFLCS